MITRWQIAAKLSDGRSACIYVHCDVYPEHALATLQQHYTDPQKIDLLIGLGDCLSVGDEIEKCDTFFSRDAPWEDVSPTYGDDLKTVADKHQHGDEDYRYTWDGQQWTMARLENSKDYKAAAEPRLDRIVGQRTGYNDGKG